jgi:hypothetical protein
MITQNDIKNIIIIFIILFVLDFIYLYVNQNWYKNQIIKSQGTELK